MKFKPVPPAPDSLETVAAAQAAVPLVPSAEADCCARLLDELELPSRDVARTWLTFLRALSLVVETDSGFTRRRTEPTREHVRENLLARVYGVETLLAVLLDADGPIDAADAFERFRSQVPNWEALRDPAGWEERWRERVRHLLNWLVLVGLAERVESGYVAAGDAEDVAVEE